MAKYTILIIEDNHTTRKLFSLTLAKEGYIVIEAETGNQALEYAKSLEPDLILQDILLPDIDGIELNRQIRKLPHCRDIPILALSGFMSKMDDIQIRPNSFTAFFLKPISPTHLVEIVKTYLPVLGPNQQFVGQGQTILIVDDDPIQLKLLGFHLKQSGFTILYANNGKEALSQLESKLPDAVISDILMPNIDGFELCLKIRQNAQYSHIPVILTTAHYLEKADLELAKKVGANNYITRTPDYKALIDALIKCLESQKAPAIPSESNQLLTDEHIQTVVRQLERQVIANSGLAKRCAEQSTELSLLHGVVHSIIHSNNTLRSVLQHILPTCLDATGISKGALYLHDKHQHLSLLQYIGYSDNEKIQLESFFENQHLLMHAFYKQNIIQIPSVEIPTEITNKILKSGNISTGVIIPLMISNVCLGVLFLGANLTDFMRGDFTQLTQTLSKQISEAIALATTFERMQIIEKQYCVIMENTSCGIFIFNKDGTILEINKKIELMFGLNKNKIIGKDYREFIVPDDRKHISQVLKKILIENRTESNEAHIIQAGGGIIDIEFSVTKSETDGETLLIAILTDVTERNRLREKTINTEELPVIDKTVVSLTPNEKQKSKSNLKSHKRAHVLAVDDDPTLLITIEKMLKDDHDVTTALGGRAALNMLMNQDIDFDIIISDINMPDTNGVDLYRFLSQTKKGLAQHIIFITGDKTTATYNQFIKSVNISCIEKPFSRKELLLNIEKVLTRKSALATHDLSAKNQR